jgi:two-component system chemotaxis response regulator CheB
MTAGAGAHTVRAVVVQDVRGRPSRLVDALCGEGDIVVIGRPTTSVDAIREVAVLRPGVVVLDLHLPDGQSQYVIEQIMARSPTPILVLSAPADDHQAPSAVDALVAGALEALPRPPRWTPELGADLRRTVRRISRVTVIRHPRGSRAISTRHDADRSGRRPVVAIAASTGGPNALAVLLAGLGGLRAPVLVVQHLHPDFITGLVEWMSRVCPLPVETARHRQSTRPGRVYFAPGEHHLHYCANGRLELAAAPATVHRPSADELFRAVAAGAGSAGIGVLLTGMGEDGAAGLLAMHRQGAATLAQDEASSAVFGMPQAANRLGAVTTLLPLDKLAGAIQQAVCEVLS